MNKRNYKSIVLENVGAVRERERERERATLYQTGNLNVQTYMQAI